MSTQYEDNKQKDGLTAAEKAGIDGLVKTISGVALDSQAYLTGKNPQEHSL